MNFRESYKKEYEKIVPDEEFLTSLQSKLICEQKEKEEASSEQLMSNIDKLNKQKSDNTLKLSTKRKVQWIIVGIVACFLFMFGVSMTKYMGIFHDNNHGKVNSIKVQGNKNDSKDDCNNDDKDDSKDKKFVGKSNADDNVNSNVFRNSRWYGESKSPINIYEIFISRLADQNDLTKLYKNNRNEFVETNLMSSGEIIELINEISKVQVSGEDINEINQNEYYMSEFANNDIIKFTIVNNQYLKIKGINYVYKLTK